MTLKYIIPSMEKSHSTYTGTPVIERLSYIVIGGMFSYLYPKPAPEARIHIFLSVYCSYLARGLPIIGTNTCTFLIPNWRHSHVTICYMH